MSNPRNPEGWFVSLKDAKTGKISELMIARTPEAAEEWRAKGYIVRPFIYLAEPEGELRVCGTCAFGSTSGILPENYYWCSSIVTDMAVVQKRDGLPYLSDNGELMVPKDHYCKLWEKKDESVHKGTQ